MKQKLILILLALWFVPCVAVAQTSTTPLPTYSGVEQSITSYLCTPSEPPDGQDLERCINRMYRFGITAGAVVLVLMIVAAGYIYITSGETGKTKAKSIVMNSLVGMGILIGSYALLYFINPNLTTFRPIQPPIFNTVLPDCAAVGLGVKCTIVVDGETVTSDGSGIFGGDYNHDQSAQLASQLLANSKVITNCYNNSNTGPKKNLEDAAAKQPSQTNANGKTYLHQAMLNGLVRLTGVVNSYCISEIAGGGHSDNSRHYVGLGFDIAAINGSTANASNPGSAKVMDACRAAGATEVLGPLRPDPGHSTHVHCGWPRPK